MMIVTFDGGRSARNGGDNGAGERQDGILREASRRLSEGDPHGAEQVLAILWADTTRAPSDVLHLLGHIRWAQRRLPEAEGYFRQAIETEPEAPQYRAALGKLFASIGAHAEAVKALSEALRLDPDNAGISVSLARSALSAGQATLAERAARGAIVATPSATTWELLARALGLQDRLDEALVAIDEALELDAESTSAQLTRSDLLARIGRNEEALAALDALADRGHITPAIAYRRGAALSNLTRLEEAEGVFAEGVARWSDNATLHKALAKARWMRGEGAAFARDFEAAVAEHPDDVRLRLFCADLLRLADFRDRSEALLREGLARSPQDPALLSSLGMLLDELDRTIEGLPLLQSALAIAPRGEIRENFACALLRLGRGDEALREIEQLRRADPLNQAWIGYETLALRQLGHSRYSEYCDFDTMVRPYMLSPPSGFATIEAFNEALADSLSRLHVLKAHPLDQSVRGGSQTSRSLIHVDDPIIQTFLKMRDEPIRDYIDSMGRPDRFHPWSGRKTGDYRLTGAWSVKLNPCGYHINHVHPAGWISGPYYVQVPKVVSEGDGQQGWVTFGAPRWPTPGCPVERTVQPKPGLQVLFPSYMWHGTIPFSAGERMTAPLDAVPV